MSTSRWVKTQAQDTQTLVPECTWHYTDWPTRTAMKETHKNCARAPCQTTRHPRASQVRTRAKTHTHSHTPQPHNSIGTSSRMQAYVPTMFTASPRPCGHPGTHHTGTPPPIPLPAPAPCWDSCKREITRPGSRHSCSPLSCSILC